MTGPWSVGLYDHRLAERALPLLCSEQDFANSCGEQALDIRWAFIAIRWSVTSWCC